MLCRDVCSRGLKMSIVNQSSQRQAQAFTLSLPGSLCAKAFDSSWLAVTARPSCPADGTNPLQFARWSVDCAQPCSNWLKFWLKLLSGTVLLHLAAHQADPLCEIKIFILDSLCIQSSVVHTHA